MSSLTSKSVYMVYGSQTGNASSLANDFSSELEEIGVPIVCLALNELRQVPLLENALCLVVICSTCGNGDFPENADFWWRSIKARAQPKTMFQCLPYTVLGFGDVKYKKFNTFCAAGVKIDKRMEELGAKRFHPIAYADESDNLEETVEEWKVEMRVKIQELVAASGSSSDSTDTDTA